MIPEKIASHDLETAYGRFGLSGYIIGNNQTLLVLHYPERKHSDRDFLLRVQYGCVNGTVFKATDCDCGYQIDESISRIAENERGALAYFMDYEGFGLGIVNKMKVVEIEKKFNLTYLQALKHEDIPKPRNEVLWSLKHVLANIGVHDDVVLLGNNVEKAAQLRRAGISIKCFVGLTAHGGHSRLLPTNLTTY